MNNFSRAASAFVLMVSLLASSLVAVGQTTTQKPSSEPPPPVPVLKKTPAQTDSTTTTQDTTPAKQADKKIDRQTPAIVPASTGSKKALSTNEDPSMIGKRNINGGFVG